MTTESTPGDPRPIDRTNTEQTDTITKADHEKLIADIKAAYELDATELADVVLKQIPDGLKALIPEALSPTEKVKWFEKAKAAGLLAKLVVPETDTTKPALTFPKVDPSELPPIARMSYGYATSNK